MVFSSLEFIFIFMPVFFAVYFLLPGKLKNIWIFIGSVGFYTYGALDRPVYILLLLFCILLNYLLALGMEAFPKARKAFLIIGLLYDFGVLFVFKYLDFLLGNLNALIAAIWPLSGVQLPLASLTLPIGISFYTFQIVSYLADVYRGAVPAERSPVKVGAYLSMFPQLIAGPIVTYTSVSAQFDFRRHSLKRVNSGLMDFTVGLGLKVLLANQIGKLWTDVSTIGFESISTPLAWMGSFAYSMQLYFDFFGYSVMAIGLGKMMGFKLPQNFDHPYIAVSFTDFWRRWHKTLSGWFRDYVYIPLGGNRQGKGKMYRNLLIVWLLTGLWHGAAWNFVLWGLVTFVLIAIEKLGFGKFLEKHRAIGHLYMIFMIPLTWTVFAITDFRQLGIYFTRLFPFFGEGINVYAGDFLKYGKHYWILFAVCVLFSTTLPQRIYKKIKGSILCSVLLLAIFWGAVYCLYIGLDDPFLYFRF